MNNGARMKKGFISICLSTGMLIGVSFAMAPAVKHVEKCQAECGCMGVLVKDKRGHEECHVSSMQMGKGCKAKCGCKGHLEKHKKNHKHCHPEVMAK
jgi:hypothetical protein